MVFSSPIFLFLFLPITVLLILIADKKFSNLILLIASLFFYAWGEPGYIVVMLLSITINYVLGLCINSSEVPSTRKSFLVLAIACNLILLIAMKYANFLVDNINSLSDVLQINLKPVHLPIGISFFTFQAMSYVIDVYRKETPVQKNPINIALYISLFPQLIAGPIVRYHDIAKQIVNRTITSTNFAYGVKRFVIGLGKKVLIANIVAEVADQIFAMPNDNLCFSLAWLGVVSYTLQIYFDFSGYSDMAIGLGNMFGFKFLENFNYPYIACSIKDFWRRWHISLSSWFRDYLYIPLGGSKKSAKRTYFNLIFVFLLCGLWHGASWSFIIWGAFHGFFLILERTKIGGFVEKIWKPFRWIYTIVVVLVGWCFFRAETLTQAFAFIKNMFSFNFSIYQFNNILIYLTPDVIAVLALGTIGCSPIVKLFRTKNNILSNIYYFFTIIFVIVIFFLCAIYLASGTYNPFIYFRF